MRFQRQIYLTNCGILRREQLPDNNQYANGAFTDASGLWPGLHAEDAPLTVQRILVEKADAADEDGYGVAGGRFQ